MASLSPDLFSARGSGGPDPAAERPDLTAAAEGADLPVAVGGSRRAAAVRVFALRADVGTSAGAGTADAGLGPVVDAGPGPAADAGLGAAARAVSGAVLGAGTARGHGPRDAVATPGKQPAQPR